MCVQKIPMEGSSEKNTKIEILLSPPRFIHVEIQQDSNSPPIHYLLQRKRGEADHKGSSPFSFKLWKWSSSVLKPGAERLWKATDWRTASFPRIPERLEMKELSQILARRVVSLLDMFEGERPTLIQITEEEVKDDEVYSKPKVVIRVNSNSGGSLLLPELEGKSSPGVILRMVRSAPPDRSRTKILKAKGHAPEVIVYLAPTAEGAKTYVWNRSGPSKGRWIEIGVASLPRPPLTVAEINSRKIPPLETVLFLLPDILVSAGIIPSAVSKRPSIPANLP